MKVTIHAACPLCGFWKHLGSVQTDVLEQLMTPSSTALWIDIRQSGGRGKFSRKLKTHYIPRGFEEKIRQLIKQYYERFNEFERGEKKDG